MTNFKVLRERAGYSQVRLAKLLSVSYQAVGRWDAGSAMPRADKLPKLARILDCKIEDFYKERLEK